MWNKCLNQAIKEKCMEEQARKTKKNVSSRFPARGKSASPKNSLKTFGSDFPARKGSGMRSRDSSPSGKRSQESSPGAFYKVCLGNVNLNVTNHTCSDYVCKNSTSSPLADSPESCSDSACFQPYTFICPLPLEILWYIIYWLFFLLSW